MSAAQIHSENKWGVVMGWPRFQGEQGHNDVESGAQEIAVPAKGAFLAAEDRSSEG